MEINNVKIDWGPILEGQIKYLEENYPDIAVRESYRGIIEQLNSNKIKSRIILSGINVAAYAFVMESQHMDDRVYGSIGFTDSGFATVERIQNLVSWAESIAKTQNRYLMVNDVFNAESLSERYLLDHGYMKMRRERMTLNLHDGVLPEERFPKEFEVAEIFSTTYQEYSKAEYEAYDGTPDRILFHTSKEMERFSLARSIFEGNYGEIISSASFAVRHHQKLIAAIMVTKKYPSGTSRSALIADLFVNRDYRGNGLGRTLLVNSLNRLKSLGYDSVQLWVSDGNNARKLYTSVGFIAEPKAKEIFYYRKP